MELQEEGLKDREVGRQRGREGGTDGKDGGRGREVTGRRERGTKKERQSYIYTQDSFLSFKEKTALGGIRTYNMLHSI